MPLKMQTKLQEAGSGRTIVVSIPKPIVQHFGLKKGDTMDLWIDEEKGTILLQKSTPFEDARNPK